ncbi:MAG: peptide ABC transporter substrate-binding protein [Rhabdochlamydiaceae bacterium]|nr:peptide ABC transporter substrate-binding protein [Rhabdochlamydiaceae bacterium]
MPVIKRRKAKKTGQILRINLKEDPSCLDPRRGRNMSSDSQVQAMLFEGLMRFESDGSLTCAQASHYELSSDRTTYTFHLKSTFWSDGTPVTAHDFEYTWKNILTPTFPSLDPHALFCIKNAQGAKEGIIPLSEVGIRALDDKTLVVELERPTLYFLHIAASSVLFPINAFQDQLFPDWHLEATPHFIGNGPFTLNTWEHNREIILEKNLHYRLADQIKLDQIQIHMINSGIARLHMHASGLFDIVGLPLSNLPHDLYREMLQQNLLHVIQTPGTMGCMFNTKQEPFNNVHIRKAFAYSINRKQIVDRITYTKEKPAFGIIPPQFKEHSTPQLFKDNDIVTAQRLLEIGLKELNLTARDLQGKLTFSFWKHDHCCPELPQFLHDEWKEKLNVNVELEALNFKTLHQKGREGNFSMGYFVPASIYFDPIEILERFKYSNNPRNYPRWENAQYIKLINQSEQTASVKERLSLLNLAEEILMEQMPFAPIFHWNYALLVQPHVKGFCVSPLGYLNFDRISIKTTFH